MNAFLNKIKAAQDQAMVAEEEKSLPENNKELASNLII
jgi:hypothetical protein